MIISNVISLYKSDTGDARYVTLSDKNGTVDLTDAEVTFGLGNYTITPQKLDDGRLLLTFEEAHLEKTGWFNCCFKVKYSDGRVETYPDASQSQIKVNIKEC